MLTKRTELVIGNIVRRVLHLIRTEATEDRNDANPSETPSEGMVTPVEGTAPALTITTSERPAVVRAGTSTVTLPRSLSHLLSETTISDQEGVASPFGTSGASTPQHQKASSGKLNELRAEIINGIQEIIEEIDSETEQIGLQADVQIRPNDNVFLFKPGPAMQRFILRMAHKRKFMVWIYLNKKPENRDEVPYTQFRNKLKKSGCSVCIACGTGPGSYMSTMHRVFLEASAITGSGAAVTDVSGPVIALAAREFNVPLFILAGIYKFSPQIPFSDHDVIEYGPPSPSFHAAALQGCIVGLRPETALIRASYVHQYISNM